METDIMNIVSPAYGRDYKNKKEALAAWESGVDFVCETVTALGRYCSCRDFGVSETVELRYKSKMNIAMVKGHGSDIMPHQDCEF